MLVCPAAATTCSRPSSLTATRRAGYAPEGHHPPLWRLGGRPGPRAAGDCGALTMEDLQGLLERFERAGRLLRITTPVDPRFELPGVCTRLHRDPERRQQVALFENVVGHDMPVVGNLSDTREKVAFALDCDVPGILWRGVRALDEPIAPVLVESGPCQEVVIEPPDLRRLPLCTNSELDGGPYVNVGLHLTVNPATGKRNMGVQRNMYHE